MATTPKRKSTKDVIEDNPEVGGKTTTGSNEKEVIVSGNLYHVISEVERLAKLGYSIQDSVYGIQPITINMSTVVMEI